MTEYKSFMKTVKAGEGDRCNYPTRLDPYGCGFQHNCSYCYAKSLLEFRGLWNPCEPRCADIEKIRRAVKRLPKGTPPVRLGGMTDPFMPMEKEKHLTYETIKALQEHGQSYLIVTKSAIVADPEYLELMKPDFAHIQITVTSTDDNLSMTYESASPPSERLVAFKTLQDRGFDVQLRLSPYLESNIDPAVLQQFSPNKAVVEFLRINHWIEKWFSVDPSQYTEESGGYKHLPLPTKTAQMNRLIQAMPNTRFTVCEDEPFAYNYWKHYFNPNPDDCCDLAKLPSENAGNTTV